MATCTPVPVTVLVAAYTAGLGLAMGYLNERLAGGSLVPSWSIHAWMSLVVAVAAAFSPT